MVCIKGITNYKTNYYLTIKFNKKEINILLNEKDNLKLALSIGDEFIYDNANIDDVLISKSFNCLASKNYTIAEMLMILYNHTHDLTELFNVITYLIECNYLNDERYIKYYIKDSIELKNHGPNLIEFRLIKKGVDYHFVSLYLQDYTTELQLENIYNYIITYCKRPGVYSLSLAMSRLNTNLLRKGYSTDVISIAVKEKIDFITEKVKEEKNIIIDYKKLIKKYPKEKVINKLFQKGYPANLILKL